MLYKFTFKDINNGFEKLDENKAKELVKELYGNRLDVVSIAEKVVEFFGLGEKHLEALEILNVESNTDIENEIIEMSFERACKPKETNGKNVVLEFNY